MGKTERLLAEIWSDESGISAVEYAMLLAFVAAGIIFAAETLSDAVRAEMERVGSCLGTGDTNIC